MPEYFGRYQLIKTLVGTVGASKYDTVTTEDEPPRMLDGVAETLQRVVILRQLQRHGRGPVLPHDGLRLGRIVLGLGRVNGIRAGREGVLRLARQVGKLDGTGIDLDGCTNDGIERLVHNRDQKRAGIDDAATLMPPLRHVMPLSVEDTI